MTNIAEKKWLSILEAAQYLSVSEPTLYRWMKEDKLSYYKVGESTRFLESDLELMIRKHTGSLEIDTLRGTCALCNGSRIEAGELVSTGKVYFKAAHTKFLTLQTSEVGMQANVCMDCGHVQLFADLTKVKKLIDEDK